MQTKKLNQYVVVDKTVYKIIGVRVTYDLQEAVETHKYAFAQEGEGQNSFGQSMKSDIILTLPDDATEDQVKALANLIK